MLNLRPFQIVLIAIFCIFGIVAVLLLSNYNPSTTVEEERFGDQVVIWGTLPASAFSETLSELRANDSAYDGVSYREIDERTFDSVLVNAIAEGRSPDLVLLPNTELIRQRNRLLAISYDTFSLRDFRDAYIDGAEIFMLGDGTYALPLAVDPLVMYWNRDLLATAGLAGPPTTWEFLVATAAPNLIRRDSNRTVLQSAVAFGTMSNVENGKEILLLLALQSGSRLVYESGSRYIIALNQSLNETSLPPLEAALQFYTSFSNPNASLYSWNRSFTSDRNSFIAGDLALYFGFGSELPVIQTLNPNLNFDVASVPQGSAATVVRNYGEFYGLAIPKASANVNGAFQVAFELTSPAVSLELAKRADLVSASRQVFVADVNDPYFQNMYQTALTARGWLDPNPSVSAAEFMQMNDDVSSGRRAVGAAVDNFEQRLRLLF